MRVGTLLSHNIDLKRRSIYLTGDVDIPMYETVVKGLHLLQDQGESIMVYLNTYGGDFYQCMAIFDLIKNSPVPVDVCCFGAAMSAGSMILQAGRKRLITPGGYIMIHYGEETTDSTSSAAHNKELLSIMKAIYKDKVTVRPRTLNGWLAKDTYFNARRALEVGLVDEIVKWR